jgi:hypothetical protein
MIPAYFIDHAVECPDTRLLFEAKSADFAPQFIPNADVKSAHEDLIGIYPMDEDGRHKDGKHAAGLSTTKCSLDHMFPEFGAHGHGEYLLLVVIPWE